MNALAASLKSGNRRAISKAISLVESTKPEHEALALRLLNQLKARDNDVNEKSIDKATQHVSIGISGPPGAGKSSVIEELGCCLVEQGHKVAVLAIDPSSESSGGAILGDKTRMPRLSSLNNAFVRPSPSRGSLGGVSRSTADAMTICFEAGFTHVLVETVGVGQSELAVSNLVDCFTLILPPVGGDELQSIKRGITEVADIVLVNKADGPTRMAAMRAAATFKATLGLRPSPRQSWSTAVLPISAHTGAGFDTLLKLFEEFFERMSESGELAEVRLEKQQRRGFSKMAFAFLTIKYTGIDLLVPIIVQYRAMQRTKIAWTVAEERLLEDFRKNGRVRHVFNELASELKTGGVVPRFAAAKMLDSFSPCRDQTR